MKTEKLAVIGLVIIIAVALSSYLVVTYGDEILNNLTGSKETVEVGDCVDVNYIGSFENGTIFDTSYDDPESKTGGTPLNIFVSLNISDSPPDDYAAYSSGMIEGFMEGLIGIKEGETKTIGPIPPEKAYGVYPKIGDYINISDPTLGEEIDILIANIIENATMPEEYVDMLGNGTTTLFILKFETYKLDDKVTLYYSWENATVVTKINETKAWFYTTPPEDKQENFTWIDLDSYFGEVSYWENASSITKMNDTTIIVTHNPEINSTLDLPDFTGYTTYTVLSLTDDKINTSYIDTTGNTSYMEFDRTVTIQRNESQNITITYPLEALDQLLSIIKSYYDPDITLSVSDLAGKTLYFEVEIVNLYKTSQQ